MGIKQESGDMSLWESNLSKIVQDDVQMEKQMKEMEKLEQKPKVKFRDLSGGLKVAVISAWALGLWFVAGFVITYLPALVSK